MAHPLDSALVSYGKVGYPVIYTFLWFFVIVGVTFHTAYLEKMTPENLASLTGAEVVIKC